MRKLKLFKKNYLLKLINLSLLLGHMRRTLKRGVINSLIKKRNVDQLAKYHPILNFQFISKVLNNSVALQLCPFVHRNDICEMFFQIVNLYHSLTSWCLSPRSFVSAVLRTTDHNILFIKLHFGNEVQQCVLFNCCLFSNILHFIVKPIQKPLSYKIFLM